MSYKFSTGSVRQGDIYFEDDRTGAATYIDFGEDTITLRPSASAILYAEDDAVGIGTTDPATTLHVVGGSPNFRVQDSDTNYAFTVDGTVAAGMRWHIGDMDGAQDSFMTMGAYDSINNIDTSVRDFHIYGTNTTTGFYFDESAGKFGIGVTAPDEKLHVSGNLKVGGDDPRIKIVADTDDHPGLEFYENSTRKWIIYNNYVNDNLTFKTDGDIRMSIKQGGNVGIGTQAPGSTFHTSGSIGVNVTSFTADASIGITHHTCIVDCGPGGANGSVTLTLPTATNAISGRTYILKRADTGGTAPFSALMTVARNGKPIDGASSNLTLGNGDCYTIQCVNGTAGWIIVGHYVP